jgi:hypothetical protein
VTEADIHFHFDPVCPFAWLTSRWVNQVASQREYSVDWRFIALRILNKHIDYDAHFPPEYEQGHNAGLRMLRLCAAARSAHGRDVVGPLYTALGASIFDVAPPDDPAARRAIYGTPEHIEPLLESLGLPSSLADSLSDENWDGEIERETEDVLSRTGRDVGTPIIHFQPPDGVAFFGPVISRLPNDEDAVRLWDHVIGLASFPGFSEMKRSLRELPQLRLLGVEPGEAGVQQDWHAGSRRLKE